MVQSRSTGLRPPAAVHRRALPDGRAHAPSRRAPRTSPRRGLALPNHPRGNAAALRPEHRRSGTAPPRGEPATSGSPRRPVESVWTRAGSRRETSGCAGPTARRDRRRPGSRPAAARRRTASAPVTSPPPLHSDCHDTSSARIAWTTSEFSCRSSGSISAQRR